MIAANSKHISTLNFESFSPYVIAQFITTKVILALRKISVKGVLQCCEQNARMNCWIFLNNTLKNAAS